MGLNLKASFGDVNLTVTPDRMYQAANNIEGKVNSSKKLFAEMIDIISATSGYWDGAVADQERRNFVNENENFETMISNLSNYVNELRAMTSIYEITEQEVTEISNSLPTNLLD